MPKIPDDQRNRMLGRLAFGIRNAERAFDALSNVIDIDSGQFRLDLSNAEEAIADVRKRFDDSIE